MTWAEWNRKWCHEIDSAMERAHMALKEAGIDWAHLARFPEFSGCGHTHLSVGWITGGHEVPLEAMKKATKVAWPTEMTEEWCQLMDEQEPEPQYGTAVRS